MTNVSNLLSEGLSVTLIGMSVVFVLLTLLVGVVHAMSAFSRLFATDAEAPAPSATDDDQLIGIIAAAVHAYRRSRSTTRPDQAART